MLNIPVIRWGKEYESLNTSEVKHFATGEPLAKVGQANAGLLARDMKKANKARDILRQFSINDLIDKMKKAGDLYANGTLPIGDGMQSPEDFAKHQSASTGLPEHMCRANMEKNKFVLDNMDKILDALTRGLPFDILTKGYGKEDRGVMMSYQSQSPVLGLVLPSNSPGVHTLWLPVIPLQTGLVLKPGSSEPWTPYRIVSSFVEAGVPKEAISLYPGPTDVGAEVLNRCGRAMIFGSQQTVDRYSGNPGVQVHGPGFSKIIFGDDVVDDWEEHIDLIVNSVFKNSGRGCINASSVWASRHTEEIAAAIAERIGPIEPKAPNDPEATLAAFTVEGQAQMVNASIEQKLKDGGATDVTSPKYGPRLVQKDNYAYLRPWVIHCDSPDIEIAKTEYMFPYVTVNKCPQDQMLAKMGQTLVCTALPNNEDWKHELIDATHIDRLNLGPIPTIKLNWLQPHEGNIVDFLYRARAFQM